MSNSYRTEVKQITQFFVGSHIHYESVSKTKNLHGFI